MDRDDGLDPRGQEPHISKMNEPTTSNRSCQGLITFLYCIPAVILLIAVAFLWLSHSGNKDQLEQLSVQNQKLQQELAEARAKIDDLNSGDSSQVTKDRLASARQDRTLSSAPESAETLVLQSPSVTQSDTGLTVLLTFESTTSELPDAIALMLRVPVDADSRIAALEPADKSLYSDIETHIDESGKFAVIQGTPANLQALQFNLTVSRPTKVVVQGTSGIKGFELDITPEQVAYRKL